MTGQCRALTGKEAGGHRCQLAAKHTHGDQQDRLINVCHLHFRMLMRAAREGLDTEMVDRWLDASAT